MNYVIIKVKEDGTKVALTRPGPLKPTRMSLLRFRNIGIMPIFIAENNAKGKVLEY